MMDDMRSSMDDLVFAEVDEEMDAVEDGTM
jgi:hypothetical protein